MLENEFAPRCLKRPLLPCRETCPLRDASVQFSKDANLTKDRVEEINDMLMHATTIEQGIEVVSTLRRVKAPEAVAHVITGKIEQAERLIEELCQCQ